MHSDVISGLDSTYASIFRKMQTVSAACLELVQVQTQTITSQERNASLLWMPGGVDGDRERCSGWWYRVMRRNCFYRTSRVN